MPTSWSSMNVSNLRDIASEYKHLHSLGNISKQKKSVLIETLSKVMEWKKQSLYTKKQHGGKEVITYHQYDDVVKGKGGEELIKEKKARKKMEAQKSPPKPKPASAPKSTPAVKRPTTPEAKDFFNKMLEDIQIKKRNEKNTTFV